MRDDQIAREVREYFRAEVERSAAAVGARTSAAWEGAGERRPGAAPERPGATRTAPGPREGASCAFRTAARVLAAAALIAAAPLCMFAGSRTHEPLADAIQVKWDERGRAAMRQLLRDAEGVLDAHVRTGEEQ